MSALFLEQMSKDCIGDNEHSNVNVKRWVQWKVVQFDALLPDAHNRVQKMHKMVNQSQDKNVCTSYTMML